MLGFVVDSEAVELANESTQMILGAISQVSVRVFESFLVCLFNGFLQIIDINLLDCSTDHQRVFKAYTSLCDEFIVESLQI